MVLMEADTLSIPIISTDIESTREMGDYAGVIVENSKEGILQGMHDFANGRVFCKNSDFEEYNKKVIEEFNEIIKF